MKIKYYYQQIDKSQKNQVEEYFNDKKIKRITNLLNPKDLALAIFDIRVEYFAHHNNFAAELALTIGKKEFISEKRAFNLTEALDIVLDNLVAQLYKLENKRNKK
jgi:ribosome-associated translation inhibitor RaiA